MIDRIQAPMTTDEARKLYTERYESPLVMTDNEIEEVIQTTPFVSLLSEMFSRSERNAESIRAARISYGGY